MKKDAEIKRMPTEPKITISMSKDKIDRIADRLAGELANKMYSEFMLLKHIPEIEKIKKGKIKTLKNEKARKFLETN